MKKIIVVLALCGAMILAGCGENQANESYPNDIDTPVLDVPMGIEEDGIGQVITLSDAEKDYVLAQTTQTWLDMNKEQKDELVVLIGRWWEECENRIVEDYDDMVLKIDHQMEQYYKNEVNENLFNTVCEIYGVDKNIYKK